MSPSAPTAIAALASGATRCHLPVAWLGSIKTGRGGFSFKTGTARKSNVFLVAGSYRLYAPFAEDYVRVALRRYVLRAHQEFLYRGRKPSFKKHGLFKFSDFGQKPKVLHIPRAYLNNVDVLREHVYVARVHYLAYYGKAGLFLGLFQKLQPLESEPLQIIRRSPRLKSPSAQKPCPRLFDLFGAVNEKGLCLDAARACYDLYGLAAYLDALHVYYGLALELLA